MTDYRKFNYTDENYLILRSSATYSRTDSGKCWKSKPDEIENEIVSPQHYTNYITAIPFFNNFGYGAYCRAKYSYQMPGYLPTIITTVSPGQETKIITNFEFIPIKTLLIHAGWREKEIVKNARYFETFYTDGHRIIKFITDSDGVTHSGLYDTKTYFWRG